MQSDFSNIYEDERKELLVLKAVYDHSNIEQYHGVSEEEVAEYTGISLEETTGTLDRLLLIKDVDHPTCNSGFIRNSNTKQRLKDSENSLKQPSTSITQHFTGNVGVVQTGDRNIANVTQNNYSKQNLVEVAKEIEELLNHLTQIYPTKTQSEKMTVVTKAVEQIERNPSLKSRTISAIKAAGIESLKELIDNPLVNIMIAAIEGWRDD